MSSGPLVINQKKGRNQRRNHGYDGESDPNEGGGHGGDDDEQCNCDPRALTVILGELLFVFCAINLNGQLNSSSLRVISLWGILACTITGLLLYFIKCCSNDVMKVMKRIVGVGLIIFGILYVIGVMINIGNQPASDVMWTLGIALLVAGVYDIFHKHDNIL